MRNPLMTSAALAAALALAAPAMAQTANAPEPAAKPGAEATTGQGAEAEGALERDYEQRDQSSMADPGAPAGAETGAGTMAGALPVPAEDLPGMAVHDAAGDRVGEVAEVEADGAGGLDRLIVSQGGFLGIGAKRVAVESQRVQVEEDRVVLDMTEDELAELPEYQAPEETADAEAGAETEAGATAPGPATD